MLGDISCISYSKNPRVNKSDVVWCDVAWRGVAWRGVAWRGVAWRGILSKITRYLYIDFLISR